MSTVSQILIEDTADLDSSVELGPNCREVYMGHGAILRRDIYFDVENSTSVITQQFNLVR
jgi:hypothetical protein